MGEVVWIGLGSNLGDRVGHLRFAVQSLGQHPQLEVLAVSSVFETAYVGPGVQDDYLNACVQVRCGLEPRALLKWVKERERERGRVPDGHMKPRPLDLDILLFGDRTVEHEDLVIPHPGLKERLFVLAPLAELAPEKKIPNSGETVGHLCAKIRRKCEQVVRPRPDLNLLPEGPGGITEE